jgi:NDP-sugar pyrophosphorylase family protein
MATPSHFFQLEDFEHKDLFTEAGHVWEALHKLSPYLKSQPLGKIEIEILQGVYLVDRHLISIGKGCVIESGAYIQGPCIIGAGSCIRNGAYIRGDVILGNKVVIGHATEVKHSIFLNEAQAGHFNYVGDSILGNKVNLGAGTKLANLRFDRKEIVVRIGKEKFATGLKKMGMIMGDGAQTGCNAVTNPGTIMAKGAAILPCQNKGGYIQ